METRMNEVRSLIEKLSKQINHTNEAGKLELIEADIIQDILKQLYLLVDELKDEIKKGTSSFPKTYPISEPEVRQASTPHTQESYKSNVQEVPISHAKEAVKQSTPQISMTQVQPDCEPQALQNLATSVPEAFEPKVQNPTPVQQTIETQDQVLEPHFIEEIPVMTFPKVEVTLEVEKPKEKQSEIAPVQSHIEPERIQQETVYTTHKEHENAQHETVHVIQSESDKQTAFQSYHHETEPPAKVKEPASNTTTSGPASIFSKTATNKASTPNDLFGGQTIADKLKNEAPSLNDKINQGMSDHSFAHKMQLKPISDLKTAIGINEKFQFVNDLFEGRTELYNVAIGKLNNCNSGNIAISILEDLKVAHNWKEEAEAYNKLKTFINRRYI